MIADKETREEVTPVHSRSPGVPDKNVTNES
jgi:hypothetical protein